MVDRVDPTQEYSVQLFQKDARLEIDALLAAQKIPVLCGGTGLYLDAVIDQMHFPSGTVGSKVAFVRATCENGWSRCAVPASL